MTPLRIVVALNGIIILSVYACAYTFNYGGEAKLIALLAPFVISVINLCLGVLSLLLVGILKLTKSDNTALADKYMQAFMIGFGITFAYGVPACLFGMQHL